MYGMHYFYCGYVCYLSRLRWKVILQYFNGVSAIYMEKNTISPKVVYTCFQSIYLSGNLPYYILLIFVC